MSDIG